LTDFYYNIINPLTGWNSSNIWEHPQVQVRAERTQQMPAAIIWCTIFCL